MALMLREALPKGAMPRVKFSLPSSTISMELETEVAWTDVKGHAGLRFQHVPKSSQLELEHWLDQRIEQEFPGTKERLSSTEKNQ